MITTSVDIENWGMDHDPENEPTYPIKNYTGDDHLRIKWERPPMQKTSVEILKSNERPTKSAVFGTTQPPSGLSGVLRRYAFRHSENLYRHWLPLLFADRINVIEGILDDLVHFRITNLAAEEGWKPLWKYAPGRLIKKLLIRFIIISAIITLIVYCCVED